jgi:hypothetical protein
MSIFRIRNLLVQVLPIECDIFSDEGCGDVSDDCGDSGCEESGCDDSGCEESGCDVSGCDTGSVCDTGSTCDTTSTTCDTTSFVTRGQAAIRAPTVPTLGVSATPSRCTVRIPR